MRDIAGDLKYTLKPPETESEKNFIASSFRASLLQGGDYFWVGQNLPNRGTGHSWFDREIDRRLEHIHKCAVVVHGEVSYLGWGASDDGWLHYIYIKQPYRQLGLARVVWNWFDKPLTATHWTRGMNFWRPSAEIRYLPSYWRDHK